MDHRRPWPIAQIAVHFRLAAHQSRWHLIQVQFDTPLETERPVFVSATFFIGAGLAPEAMAEEGLLVVAMGRLATAKIAFDIDERGVPIQLKALSTSDPVWGSEATAVIGQWRFTPGKKNGIACLSSHRGTGMGRKRIDCRPRASIALRAGRAVRSEHNQRRIRQLWIARRAVDFELARPGV